MASEALANSVLIHLLLCGPPVLATLCVTSNLSVSVHPSICLFVVCQLLTQKMEHRTMFRLLGLLNRWGVIGKATCRSQSQRSRSLGAEMWHCFGEHLHKTYTHVKPRLWWPAFHATHFIQYSAAAKWILFEVTGSQYSHYGIDGLQYKGTMRPLFDEIETLIPVIAWAFSH